MFISVLGVLILCHLRDWEGDELPTPELDFYYSKPISSRHFPANCYLSQSDWREGDILFLGERIFPLLYMNKRTQSPVLTNMFPKLPLGWWNIPWRWQSSEVEWTWVRDNIILGTYCTGPGAFPNQHFSLGQINSLLFKPILWSYLPSKNILIDTLVFILLDPVQTLSLSVVTHSLP